MIPARAGPASATAFPRDTPAMHSQLPASPPASPWRSRLAAAAGFLPLAASLIASLVGPAESAVPLPERPPALAFLQYAVSFRRPQSRPVVHAQFDFTNRGPETVEIQELEPSCECLRPTLYDKKTTFEPGESGGFVVEMRTAREQPGPHSYSIVVRYTDPEPREEVLSFRVMLPERKVSIEPPEVYFYQLTGQADERVVHVVDARERPLRVTGVSSSSDLLSVAIQPLQVDADGRERTPIRLVVGEGVPSARTVAIVSVQTDDAEFPELTFPVLIQGPAEGVLPVSAESSPLPGE